MADRPSADVDVAVLLDALPQLRQREETRRALLSPRQPAFAYVKERVAAEDVAALRMSRDGSTPPHRLLTPRAAAASSVRSLVGRRPFLSEEPAAPQSLRASAAMGPALVGDAGRSADEPATGRQMRTDPVRTHRPDDLRPGLADRFRDLVHGPCTPHFTAALIEHLATSRHHTRLCGGAPATCCPGPPPTRSTTWT
ncbi:hypothetical protein [Streptomyces sp. NPDC008122]|uniref:hypothetical protein n=1 Tax=Streptomyces sp. NPDC008122 TaxID=3364810 RepID=UPI0036EF641D